MEINSTNCFLNSTLWQSFNYCDCIVSDAYYAIAKSKSIIRKLKVLIFLYKLI